MSGVSPMIPFPQQCCGAGDACPLCGSPPQAPARRPSGFLWIASLRSAVGPAVLPCRLPVGPGWRSFTKVCFLGLFEGVRPDSLTLKICYPRDLMDSFWMHYVTLTFLRFLAENYICESVPLEEVVQTVGKNFFQTWGGKAKKNPGGRDSTWVFSLHM